MDSLCHRLVKLSAGDMVRAPRAVATSVTDRCCHASGVLIRMLFISRPMTNAGVGGGYAVLFQTMP